MTYFLKLFLALASSLAAQHRCLPSSGTVFLNEKSWNLVYTTSQPYRRRHGGGATSPRRGEAIHNFASQRNLRRLTARAPILPTQQMLHLMYLSETCIGALGHLAYAPSVRISPDTICRWYCIPICLDFGARRRTSGATELFRV